MNIEWNKVTWYSKAIALGVFVALIIMAFWFGVGYGQLAATLIMNTPSGTAVSASTASGDMSGAEYYSNPAEWQAYSDTNGGYVIAYPIDFETVENFAPAPTTNWQILGDLTPGDLGFTLTIPASFEPQTNFADAKLTVGWSGSDAAISGCMTPNGGGLRPAATTTISLGSSLFTIFYSSDAGAGNFYETTSYRTLHAGRCYAIEYTIHSAQIGNFPGSYNLHPFDEKMLTDVLDRIVGTFKFQ